MNVKKILIAVDSSEFSLNAARVGIELAKSLGAAVTIVYIIEELKVLANPDAGFNVDEAMLILKKEAEETIATIRKLHRDLEITVLMPAGDPRKDIIATTLEIGAEMIVVGTHGRTGLRHALIGSVAEYIVRHSSVPILVVPMK